MKRMIAVAVVAAAVGCKQEPPPAPAKPKPRTEAKKPEAPAAIGEEKSPPATAKPKPRTEAKKPEAPAATGEVVMLTDANFAAKTSKGVVLVDFWAPWCPPCKMQGPIVEEIAKDFAGRVTVCKLNVDDGRSVAGKLRIEAIPTLIVFKAGEVASRMVGLRRKEQLSAELEKVLRR